MSVLQTKIVKIGKEVKSVQASNALIFFGKEAPEDLSAYCVILNSHDLKKDVKAGMYLCFGDAKYEITAVGEHANKTLFTMGHSTLYFDGERTARLPGCIHLEQSSYPEILVEMPISIEED